MKKLSLTVNKQEVKGKELLEEVQSELVDEEKGTLKDFIKGAYRFSLQKQKEIKRLQEEVDQLDAAVEEATKGNWEPLGQIKIPARFFDEKTLRQHNKSLLSGAEEVRFVDLYVE